MAEVWLAERAPGDAVAIKILRDDAVAHAPRFAAEIDALQRLDHRGIVHLVASGRHGGRPWFAMDVVDGADLAVLGERLRGRPVSERHGRAREVGVQLAEALGYLHACGLIHRDVKPANVLFADGRAVLADFGAVAEADAPVGGGFVGSVAWAAPEALLGGRVDASADQYGFGLVLYWLLTGHRPFDEGRRAAPRVLPRPPSEQDPTVPADLETIVLRCISLDPARRFPDMAAVRDALVALPASLATLVAGLQPAADRVAAALEQVARGTGWVLRLVGAAGAGQEWLAGLARVAATRRGLVCVVEEDSALAGRVAERVRAGEAILLLTSADLPANDTLELAPLGVADLRRSIFAVAPRTPDLAAAAERLRAWSGGHAALVEAALSGAVQDQRLDLAALPSPDLDPWFGPLDLDALCVAQALAALPEAVTAEVLEKVAAAPAPESLAQLERLGVAQRAGSRWLLAADAFRAPLLDRSLDPDGLRERAASALGPTTEDDPVLRAARARVDAGDHAAAITALLQAVAAAHDPGRATAERRLLLAALHWYLRDAAGAAAQWTAVRSEAADPRHRARAAIGLGVLHMQAGALDSALNELSHAQIDADLANDTHIVILACLDLAEARALRGQLPDALRAGRRARDEARALRDGALEAKANRALGQVYADIGLWRAAEATLADASALARAANLDDERLVAHALRAQVALDARPADRTAAAVALDRLLSLGGGQDPEGLGALVHAVRAEAYGRLGEPLRAHDSLARALSARPPPTAAIRVDLRIARAYAELGDVGSARALLARAALAAQTRGLPLFAWRAACALARLDGAAPPPPGALLEGLTAEEAAALLASA